MRHSGSLMLTKGSHLKVTWSPGPRTKNSQSAHWIIIYTKVYMSPLSGERPWAGLPKIIANDFASFVESVGILLAPFSEVFVLFA